jgi:hypothetical protein
MLTVDDLPHELFLYVLSWLTGLAVARAASVSHRWSRLCHDPHAIHELTLLPGKSSRWFCSRKRAMLPQRLRVAAPFCLGLRVLRLQWDHAYAEIAKADLLALFAPNLHTIDVQSPYDAPWGGELLDHARTAWPDLKEVGVAGLAPQDAPALVRLLSKGSVRKVSLYEGAARTEALLAKMPPGSFAGVTLHAKFSGYQNDCDALCAALTAQTPAALDVTTNWLGSWHGQQLVAYAMYLPPLRCLEVIGEIPVGFVRTLAEYQPALRGYAFHLATGSYYAHKAAYALDLAALFPCCADPAREPVFAIPPKRRILYRDTLRVRAGLCKGHT